MPIKDISKKYIVKISCYDKEEALKIGGQIHEQLVGNPDYINDNIVLNCTSAGCNVILFVDDVDEIPEITLFKKENK